jgi:hypothetical protein
MKFAAESGDFHLWIGGSSRADLQAAFTLRGAEDE